jgi:hypothetical protein
MEVARSKISMQISLYIIEVVTRHSQIAVWWTKKVYLHPLVSILLMEKRNQMNTSAATKSWNPHLLPCVCIICKSEKSYFTESVSLLTLFFTTIVIFIICVL